MDPANKYTQMQKSYYDNEGKTGNMNRENHGIHNKNKNYWDILVNDTLDSKFKEKIGLDFGCGCGRNVMNLFDRFKRMDGVDISSELIKTCVDNLTRMKISNDRASFYTCDGVSLSIFDSAAYDFIMSTIVLQHICVYSIRYNYLNEFFRILKPGGMISIQMGYGDGHPRTRSYDEDYYDATATNSGCDVKVSTPDQIVNDLSKIGFVNIKYEITVSFDDPHKEWIFVKAYKN